MKTAARAPSSRRFVGRSLRSVADRRCGAPDAADQRPLRRRRRPAPPGSRRALRRAAFRGRTKSGHATAISCRRSWAAARRSSTWTATATSISISCRAAASRSPARSIRRNRLYRNRGDGTFEDVTAGSGADVAGYGMGAAAGDYDNDGDTDLFVTNAGPNVLLRNDGGGRFTDVTATAGVAGRGWSTSAAFFDADADGDLDLFVLRYINWSVGGELQCFSLTGAPDYCSPRNYDAPLSDMLYRNNGDGTFTDVSDRAGLHAAFGNGLGVVVADVNRDGRPDVFVANDAMPNQLWINRGRGPLRGRSARARHGGGRGRLGEIRHGHRRQGRRRRRRRGCDCREPRRRIRLAVSERRRVLQRRDGRRRPAGCEPAASRGSARRGSTSTTMAGSISIRPTAASANRPSGMATMCTPSRACCFAASREDDSSKCRRAAARLRH